MVVDEYGEVIGIVTLEDILEEIVGDFNDLDSLDNPDIQAQEDGSFVIDGSANLRELNKSLGWHCPATARRLSTAWSPKPWSRSPIARCACASAPTPGNPAVGGKPCEKRARLASPRADPAGRKRRQRLIRDCRTRPAALYNRPQLIQPCRRFRRYPQPEPRPVTRQSRLPARPRCRRYQPAHGAQPHPPCATDLVRPTRAPRRRIGALAITIRPHGSTPSCPDCQGPSHHDRRHPRRRRRSGTGHSTTRVAVASFIGTAIEFYDFYVYATAAALVIGPVFFPQTSGTAQMLSAFLTFGIAFLARPLGSALFGHFGDRIGRKSTLVACCC